MTNESGATESTTFRLHGAPARPRAATQSSDLMGQIAGLEDAWTVTRGAGAVLAVVDEGVDVQDHPEFAGRVLPGYNQRNERDSELLRAWRPHGTKVAGLALAGGQGVTGIAPDALLLPVPVPALARRIGDRTEAEGIRWAANHGADVICCAWAPPAHSPESGSLPRHTREALDYCLTYGRDGKGCIVVFSAGNDRSDIALNGYASHPGVIAVGACNCHGKHPSYSNWGEALWCVFPSNDPLDPVGAGMSYVTTAPTGSFLQGDAFYSSSFGFTSAACAAVAGVCALVVSANPHLTAWEVKDLLRGACEQIDAEGGTYDERGHSPLYGYGRPDIARAVNLARQPEKR